MIQTIPLQLLGLALAPAQFALPILLFLAVGIAGWNIGCWIGEKTKRRVEHGL